MRLAGRRSWVLALALVASASVGGAWLLGPTVSISAQHGDWRAATVGLRLPRRSPRAREGVPLAGRHRAIVHLHGFGLWPGTQELALDVEARDATRPVTLHVARDGDPFFSVPLAPSTSRTLVRVPIAPGREGVDVEIEATPAVPAGPPRYWVHQIVLHRTWGLARETLMLLPLVGGVLSLMLLSRAGARPTSATVLSVLAAGLVAVALLALDPPSALRLAPATRTAARVVALGAVWVLAIARPSRAVAWLAVAATVGVLYLPALGYGFLTDDFYFGRPLTPGQLLSTWWGQWDPLGRANAHYRPVVALSLAIDYTLWGPEPPGYHLTNLLLCVVAGGLAYVFLRRLGLGSSGAMVGTLAWVAHPLGAAAAAWSNERTDSIACCFFIASLAALAHPRFDGRRAAWVVVLAALALCSKEMSVTLPAIAFLMIMVIPGAGGLARLRTVYGLTVLAIVYVVCWVKLFPAKAASSTSGATLTDALRDGWRAPAAFLGPLFLPWDYDSWFDVPVAELHPLYVIATIATPAAALLALYRYGSRSDWRVGLFGSLWLMVTPLPLLPLKGGIDLYRVGLLVAFGSALILGALISTMDRRLPWLARWMGAAIGLWLGAQAIPSGQAWGPGGSMMQAGSRWKQEFSGWEETIGPEMARVFRRQVQAERHAQAPPKPHSSQGSPGLPKWP